MTMNDSESKSGSSPSSRSVEKKERKKKSKSNRTGGGGGDPGSVNLRNTIKKVSKKKKTKKKKFAKKKDDVLIENAQQQTDATAVAPVATAEPPPSLSCPPATSSLSKVSMDAGDDGTMKERKVTATTSTPEKSKSKKRKRSEMSSSKKGKIDDGLVADEGDGESSKNNTNSSSNQSIHKINEVKSTTENTTIMNHHRKKKKKKRKTNNNNSMNNLAASTTSSDTGTIPTTIAAAKTKDHVAGSFVSANGNTASKLQKNHKISTSGTKVAEFPFETEPDDHCESPAEAYEDIVPILQALARKLKKSQQELSIYDPYYCDNRVARNLASLGFPNVYNRKEDCYKIWNDLPRYPSHDILVTNPPYSGDHLEKLIQHTTEHERQRGRPFALLLPVFVHKKDYFERVTNPKRGHPGFCSPIFLVPHKRYIYQPPPNFREKKVSDTHKKSSPFPSMWYLWGGSQETTDAWFRILQRQGKSSSRFSVARSKSALRDLRRKHKK